MRVMSTQATKKQVLLINDQPETLPPLVQALEAGGYQVIVVLTFCDALAWLEIGTPHCLIVHRHTLTQTDIALLRSSQWWVKQTPLVVVTSVPIPVALHPAVERRTLFVVPLFASPEVLCHLVTTLMPQEGIL
jgi:DNA-binding NtrC family response regulator